MTLEKQCEKVNRDLAMLERELAKVETEVGESWYEDFYHHLRMEMDEYRRLKRSLRVLKSYTDYEEDLYEEAV